MAGEQEPRDVNRVAPEAPITVSCRLIEGDWHCTALQFDILGVGNTREAAFAQLRELVEAYLRHALASKHEVKLFNPAHREEWNNPGREFFDLAIHVRSARTSGRPSRLRLQELPTVGGREVRHLYLAKARKALRLTAKDGLSDDLFA
ncbi:MAG TPA: hypothetical protein PK847_01665 [Candidatus Sumerlaeota bacterium]|nr:hypothetical protein [Candidatus Sumerlaeota bacterium]